MRLYYSEYIESNAAHNNERYCFIFRIHSRVDGNTVLGTQTVALKKYKNEQKYQRNNYNRNTRLNRNGQLYNNC